jgi:hypothetical protein
MGSAPDKVVEGGVHPGRLSTVRGGERRLDDISRLRWGPIAGGREEKGEGPLAEEKGHAGSSSPWEGIGGSGGSECGKGRRWPGHWHRQEAEGRGEGCARVAVKMKMGAKKGARRRRVARFITVQKRSNFSKFDFSEF